MSVDRSQQTASVFTGRCPVIGRADRRARARSHVAPRPDAVAIHNSALPTFRTWPDLHSTTASRATTSLVATSRATSVATIQTH
jgi:hypothetical protein